MSDLSGVSEGFNLTVELIFLTIGVGPLDSGPFSKMLSLPWA